MARVAEWFGVPQTPNPTFLHRDMHAGLGTAFEFQISYYSI